MHLHVPPVVRAKAVSLAAATSRMFNFALAWEYSRGSALLIFGTFNFAAFLNSTCSLLSGNC